MANTAATMTAEADELVAVLMAPPEYRRRLARWLGWLRPHLN
jgi:hypothetical protein